MKLAQFVVERRQRIKGNAFVKSLYLVLFLGLSVPVGSANADPSTLSPSYDLESLSILNRAIIHIKEHYVDPSRIDERKMVAAALERVQERVAELLVHVDKSTSGIPRAVTVRIDEHAEQFQLDDVTNLWQMSFKLRDILGFVRKHLRYHEDLRAIEYAVINGILSTLDPHSVLLKPDEYREMKLSTQGKFGGLGIVINIHEGLLTVVRPIQGTPASEVGIKKGDQIVQINLDSTVNMSLQDAVSLLRGPPRTSVTIWVKRKGWATPRRFSLTRKNISVKSVVSRRLVNDIGLVRIHNFQNTTTDELRQAVKRLEASTRPKKSTRLKGLIIDMRGNPGGLLDQAIKVSDTFVQSGPLVTTVGYGDKMREPKMATRTGTLIDLPVVVLVDPGSASASEIVAGALKNHHRALLVGQTTFGKGSVQVLYDNKDDSALKLTIAQYLTPGDVSIQSVGIVPDVAVQQAYLTEKLVDLFPNPKRGEHSLPSHLENKAKTVEGDRPDLTLPYLVSQETLDDEDFDPSDLTEDFEIHLARNILERTQGPRREELLAAASLVVADRSDLEGKKIEKALATRGIDWSDPQPKGTGRPKADVRVEGFKPSESLQAGQTVSLTVTVKNTGDAPFQRLYGITRCDDEIFDGIEFIFGRIPPGESRVWTNKLQLPASSLTRKNEVTLGFREAHDLSPESITFPMAIEERLRPRFGVTYRVDDSRYGNGDGLLQAGEESELVMTVLNKGQGSSERVLGSLSNEGIDPEKKVFILRGRIKAKGIEPLGTNDFRFRFKVKADTVGPVQVRLSAFDPDIDAGTSEKVFLDVLPAGKGISPLEGYVLPIDDGVIKVYAQPRPDATTLGTVASGIQCRGRFEDWYRVTISDQQFGWIHQPSVQIEDLPGHSSPVLKSEPLGPPVIAIDVDRFQRSVDEAHFALVGEVIGERPVKDLRIYVNNRKVYFKSVEAGKGASMRVLFSAQIPLEEGANRIELIARHDSEAFGSKVLIVNRGR